MRGLPPVTIRTAERRFRSGPNLLSDLKILAVDGLAPKWFSSSTTQDSMGIEWMTVIYQRVELIRLLRARLCRSIKDTEMKQRLLTPGPTPVPEETLLELAKPVVYHRTAESRQVMLEVLKGLQHVFQTRQSVIPLTSSGTGGLEAAIVNTLPPKSKAICLIA